MSRSSITSLVLVISLALPSIVHADENAEEHAAKAAQGRAAAEADVRLEARRVAEAPTVRWYGWQTLGMDAAALGVGLSAGGTAGLGMYSVGTPLVHWAHGHHALAVIDFGVRAVVPFTVGYFASQDCRDRVASGQGTGGVFTCEDSANLAAALPAFAITVLDLAISHDEIAPQRPAAATFGVGLAPRGEGGLSLSLGGTF